MKTRSGKRSILRALRVGVALVLFTCLLLSFAGQEHFWLAGLQLIPALLALQVAVVLALLLITLLFGRVYCSVICPLGILQDAISRVSSLRKGKKRRFSFSPARNWLRYSMLALFLAALLAGVGAAVALLEPYSAFGRMAANFFVPLATLVKNGAAQVAEEMGSYAFQEQEFRALSLPTFAIALASLILIAVLAWRHGRSYCNNICPVGTLLGFFSRFSLLGIRIDTQKCISCGLCARQCKASCINPAEHSVDASRCVACMNCLESCSKGAISYGLRRGGRSEAAATTPQAGPPAQPESPGRRNFLMGSGMALTTAAARTQEKAVDGGLAVILDKEVPERQRHIVPPGAHSHRHMARHCTGCQLCVSACPNGVLRPSATLERLMQPECSYEQGYCRPECTKCSQVCPAGAIERVEPAAKSSLQVGHAVWVKANCVVLTDGVRCGNCARHCPTGAITMVPLAPNDPRSREIPVVNEERCIGCGACEHLCPARPHSAMYVEGHEVHRTL